MAATATAAAAEAKEEREAMAEAEAAAAAAGAVLSCSPARDPPALDPSGRMWMSIMSMTKVLVCLASPSGLKATHV